MTPPQTDKTDSIRENESFAFSQRILHELQQKHKKKKDRIRYEVSDSNDFLESMENFPNEFFPLN